MAVNLLVTNDNFQEELLKKVQPVKLHLKGIHELWEHKKVRSHNISREVAVV